MFRITLESEGEETKVRVKESRSRFRVALVLELVDASRLSKCLEMVMTNGKEVQKICTFKGRRGLILVERASNVNGSFIKISEIGPRRIPLAIFVPRGKEGMGWDIFLQNFVSVLKIGSCHKGKEDLRAVDVVGPSSEGNKLSFAEVVKKRLSWVEGDMAGRWERVVVCEIEDEADWNRVGRALAKVRGIQGKVCVYPFKRLAGIFFVGSVAEAVRLQRRGKFFLEKEVKVSLKRWFPAVKASLNGRSSAAR